MELIQLGKHPISADSPAGSDAKYDAAFDQLQTEVQKAMSVITNGPVDWQNIVDLASTILASKSKDLVAAGYLAVALVHTQQAKGFVTGSQVMMDVIENFWHDGFPAKTRARGRAQAIAWWIEKASEALKAPACGALSMDQADQLCERFEKVHQFLRVALEDCPSFGPIMRSARMAAERSQTTETTVMDSPPVAAGNDDSGEIKRALNALSRQARQVSDLISKRDAADPLVYRLNRLVALLDRMPGLDI